MRMRMRADLIDALLLRRERVFRCQRQWWLQHCLSRTSANQRQLDSVLLNRTCDNNGQGARLCKGRREKGARGTWSHKRHCDRVAEQACKSALQGEGK